MSVKLSVRRRVAATFGVVAMGVGLAACGEEESGGGTKPTPNTELTGKPVTVFFQGALKTKVTDASDVSTAIEKGIEAVNASGGLNGSEVKLETCNDTDANAEVACVRKAIDAKAAAFVGSSFIYNPADGQSLMEKAGIPSIAPLAIQQADYTPATNFPIYTTGYGTLACPQQMAQAVGAKKVSAVTQDLPVQKELLKVVAGTAAVSKVPYGAGVAVPLSQGDYSGAVKQLSDSGADAIVDILSPPSQIPFFTALRSTGEDFKAYCGPGSVFSYAILGQLGNEADKAYVSTGLPPIDPETAKKFPMLQQFLDETGLDKTNLGSPTNALNGWLAVQVLKQAAEKVDGPIDAAKLLESLNRLQPDLAEAGLPPIDFSKPVPAKGFERLFNPMVSLQKWDSEQKDFVAVPDSEPVNVLELFAGLQKAGG